MVITGKHSVFMGKQLGGIYVPTVALKGSPVDWVNEAMTAHPKAELKQILERLANNEAISFPFTAGSPMGQKAFWRNAKAYFTNKTKS